MSYWVQRREDELKRLGIDVNKRNVNYTITYETRGKVRTLHHVRLASYGAHDLTFRQTTKGGERDHYFDGPEILSATEEVTP